MNKDFLFSEEVSCDVIRKCQPQLVKLLHTDPVIDHLYAEKAITVEQIDKYEDKKVRDVTEYCTYQLYAPLYPPWGSQWGRVRDLPK